MEQALQKDSGPCDPALALFAGPDVGVFCRAYLGHLFWHLGDAEQAVAKSQEAVAMAREMSHPFSLAIALDYAAMLSVFRQESKLTLAQAEEASTICRKHGFAYYLAWADILTGWAIAMEGDTATGLAHLRHGLDALNATGAELRLPFYHGLLTEVYCLDGQEREALANLASAFAFQSKNAETWFAPELHRIHGDVLLHCGDTSQAQLRYRRAIESARQIGARLPELRAEARLRNLPTLQGKAHRASER
jgi:predicted ATPase